MVDYCVKVEAENLKGASQVLMFVTGENPVTLIPNRDDSGWIYSTKEPLEPFVLDAIAKTVPFMKIYPKE